MADPDWECPTCGKRTYRFMHSCPLLGAAPKSFKWDDEKWAPVEDAQRLADVLRERDEARAEAWDEGFRAGDEAATGHLTKNPYRDTAVDI